VVVEVNQTVTQPMEVLVVAVLETADWRKINQELESQVKDLTEETEMTQVIRTVAAEEEALVLLVEQPLELQAVMVVLVYLHQLLVLP